MRFIVRRLSCFRNQEFLLLGRRFAKIGIRFSSVSTSSDEDTDGSTPTTNRKVLKVAIVGVPNAGKSTLINQIMGRSVFAMSRKVHTTRCCARAIMNVENTQLVFLDTPGVVSVKESVKHHLERSCLVDSESAIQEADVVGVLHDASNEYTKFKLDPKILRLLYLYPDKRTFLILNKVDAMKNRLDLLDCARILTNKEEKRESQSIEFTSQDFNEVLLQEIVSKEVGWSHFDEVFMVSGLTGDGVGDIQVYLTNLARPGEWIFPENAITDQKEIKIIEDAVFSKFLDYLPRNIPYELKVQLEYFGVGEDGSISAYVIIGGKSSSILRMLIGKNGDTIRKVAQEVEQSLRRFYLNDVRIRLIIKKIEEMAVVSEDEKESLLSQSK